MTPYKVYQMYSAMKLHFSNDKFDFFKYNKQTTASYASFEKRKDKHYFERISEKFPSAQVEPYLAINFFYNSNIWTRMLLEKEANDIFLNHQKKLQSFTYHFKQEINDYLDRVGDENFFSSMEVSNGQHPKLLQLVFSGKFDPEFLLLLDHTYHLIDTWSDQIEEDLIWPQIKRKYKKFSPFIEIKYYEKFANLLKDCRERKRTSNSPCSANR